MDTDFEHFGLKLGIYVRVAMRDNVYTSCGFFCRVLRERFVSYIADRKKKTS